MAKKASTATSVGRKISEWTCPRHGAVPAPSSTKSPKCKWCGKPLAQSTWVMSG